MKKKVKLLIYFLLIVSFIVVSFDFRFNKESAKADEASWYHTSWKYRKPITIDNTGNLDDLTNYQIKVTLSSSNFDFSKAQSSGEDLRFTDSDGTTLIDYWIESYDNSGQTATTWVEVPSISSSSTKTIYMYYGNSIASDASNGDNTFEFFDDFEFERVNLSSSEEPLGHLIKDSDNPIFEADTLLSHEGGDHLVDIDITKIGSTYYMLYSSSYTDTAYRCICLATSTDGITWTRGDHNPLLTYSVAGWDSQRVTYMAFLDDTDDSGKYYILYTGTPNWDIGLAESTEIDNNWTKYGGNPVLAHTSAIWHNSSVHNPVLWKKGNTYYMLFAGSQSDNQYKIGLATSTDMVNWTEYEGNPVMTLGADGTWDDVRVVPEDIKKIGDVYYLFYGGWDGFHYRIGIATSSDLHSWTKYTGNPIIDIGGSGSWDQYLAGDHSELVDIDGYWRVYYTGVNVGDTKSAIGLSFLQEASDLYSKFPLTDDATRSISGGYLVVSGAGSIATGISSWSNYIVETKARLDTDYGIAVFTAVTDMTTGSQDYNRFIWKGGQMIISNSINESGGMASSSRF